MDRHKMLKAYSKYKKLAMEMKRESKKIQVSNRHYTKIYSKSFGEQACEKFSLEGCSKRKYITLIPKAN